MLGKGSQWLFRSMFFQTHDDIRVELSCLPIRLNRRKEHSGMSMGGILERRFQDEET